MLPPTPLLCSLSLCETHVCARAFRLLLFCFFSLGPLHYTRPLGGRKATWRGVGPSTFSTAQSRPGTRKHKFPFSLSLSLSPPPSLPPFLSSGDEKWTLPMHSYTHIGIDIEGLFLASLPRFTPRVRSRSGQPKTSDMCSSSGGSMHAWRREIVRAPSLFPAQGPIRMKMEFRGKVGQRRRSSIS